MYVERKCTACSEEEDQKFQAKPEHRSLPRVAPDNLLVPHGGGRILEEAGRAFLEGKFGRDFSDVRVHNGPSADAAAKSVGARAFTVGRDIVFRAGANAPAFLDGRRLLAHELTHVVQRSASPKAASAASAPARFPPTTDGSPAAATAIAPSRNGSEVEAESIAAEMAADGRTPTTA